MGKTMAMVAHDSKKDDMVQLVKAHKEELAKIGLIATRSTGQIIQERTGLPVRLLQSGPLGGDQQIGGLVANGEVDAVIFLRDPLTAHHHEPGVSPSLRVCDVHDVPLATILTTAEADLHLIAENPEALSGHHLAAQSIREMAAIHE
ncbi:MAG: methylglyoxal synthase [candidate division WOR-3 bacterium]